MTVEYLISQNKKGRQLVFDLDNTIYEETQFLFKVYKEISKKAINNEPDIIYKFLKIENEAKTAIDEYKSLNNRNEIDLLKWLVKYENLYYELILLSANIVTEESIQTSKTLLHKNYTIYFKTNILQNCIYLQELLEKHYYENLNKYNTLSQEEQENQIPFDDEYENTSSLKYHLEKRGII